MMSLIGLHRVGIYNARIIRKYECEHVSIMENKLVGAQKSQSAVTNTQEQLQYFFLAKRIFGSANRRVLCTTIFCHYFTIHAFSKF